MRIVHIIGGGDVGGAKTHMLYLLRELSRHMEVKLISLRPGVFADDAASLGIDVSVVKSANIFSDIKKVKKIISDGKYDIVHSHGAKANIFSLAASRRDGLPTVTTVHSDYRLDYMHSLPKRMTIGLVNSIALRYIKNHIAVSNNFKEMLISRNFNPLDIYVLYNGMDFSPPSVEYSRKKLLEKYKLDIPDDNVIVGIAARLYPVKSIETIVKAAHIVKAKNSKVKFLIGGDGEDRKMLESLTAELKLEDTVFFLGWQDDPNEIMSSIDISVLTSISESFSYSILEGARFKKATISTRVGGIPDLIENGKNGFLFEPGDVDRFSELILELAADEEKRTEMGLQLYEKALAQFSVESMGRTQMGIYKGILEKKAADANGQKPYDAIISGYYGFRNIGDDALLKSILKDLKSFKPDIRLMVLSRIPSGTAMDFQVPSINRANILRIWQAMRKSKAFIYGGGNLLQDNTSTRSLFFYLSMVWLAKKLDLKVMFYANGIGPLKKSLNRLLTKKIINKVDVITLREALSFDELKHLEISKPRILLTADAALTVMDGYGSTHTNIVDRMRLDNKKPLLGISLRKYPGHEKIEHEKYESVIAQAIDYMADKYGIYPVFFPMQHPEDVPILENVAAKMHNESYIVRDKLDIQETYEMISSFTMLIGMRLHALIFSAVAAVPMIGLVYDPKIQGFLDCIQQPSAGDVLELEYGRLTELADKVWENREQIRDQISQRIPLLKEKARENARVAVELITGTHKNGL
ncbi:MAG: polysaccharide pyruvyl transferase CsaB [Clostridiaceae bacterium]|nr:polysaccharide pyruvyl transferase CsaB [Clostridiaceae bacterium]